ncbi:MAG: DUF2027 domain-containing protein [Prevotella sp.]|nr:DUF2027 domain-containing protein [Prevotella sp.]MCM1074487.1 DUF2027 domain-containing protein [Ruminococcus sp.]
MAKVGDTVRYLNAVGGGKITRIEGRMAYVDEDGFETPVLLNELVVVLPQGHENPKSTAKLLFDQKAVDAVKARDAQTRKQTELTKEVKPEPPKPLPVEETAHGEKLNLVLAFEPMNIKQLSNTQFAAALVNDSNYYLSFIFLTSSDGKQWSVRYEGTVEPNMVVDLATFTHSELPGFEHVALQTFAFKREKAFTLKPAVDCRKRLDLKKFYKLHCFRTGVYFDTPVLEVPLILNDVPTETPKPDPAALKQAMGGAPSAADAKALEAKFGKQTRKGRDRHRNASPADNPNKLLPPIEVDLHINELVDTTAGMSNSDMLNLQLDTVRRVMKTHSRRLGQKVIFIHGKGDGVLREAVRSLLKREWSACDVQDASFQEYGYGATLVTIHKNG